MAIVFFSGIATMPSVEKLCPENEVSDASIFSSNALMFNLR